MEFIGIAAVLYVALLLSQWLVGDDAQMKESGIDIEIPAERLAILDE